MAKGMFGSIAQHLVAWIRDEQGVAHAVRQSEGDCHSAFCRKFVKGQSVRIKVTPGIDGKCPECCHRLEYPAHISKEGDVMPARCILMGRGSPADRHRRIYIKDRGRQ